MAVAANEHVLVIGAGPGIGASVARIAADRGAKVTILARTPASVDPIAAELHAAGADVYGYLADAAYQPHFQGVLSTMLTERGAPTLVVYNAVDPDPTGPASTVDPELLTASLETNVTGALVTVRAVLDAMRVAGGGTIMLTGGIVAVRPYAPMTALSIGKSALRTLALCLHQELGDADPVQCRTMTVMGVVRPGGAFDPDRIASSIWDAHESGEQGVDGEITFDGRRAAAS